MFPTAKILGLSAILAVAIVTAYELPQAREPSPTHKQVERVLPSAGESISRIAVLAPSPPAAKAHTGGGTKGDSLRAKANDRCAAQTWPIISSDCIAAANGAPARATVRTITFEERTGPNTSVLVRRPAAEMAGIERPRRLGCERRPACRATQPNQTAAVMDKVRSH